MVDQEIVRLVNKWCHCLQYEHSLDVCKEIATYADLPCPQTYEEYYSILKWVDQNHPEAYLEATKDMQKSWGLKDSLYNP